MDSPAVFGSDNLPEQKSPSLVETGLLVTEN
jgi:hypothetical protein